MIVADTCVQINKCRVRRLLDGLQVDATIQHERAVKFDFHTGRHDGAEHAPRAQEPPAIGEPVVELPFGLCAR